MTAAIQRNVLNFWNGTAWVPVDSGGLTGPQGVQGPEGVRTSSGGCRFRGSQGAQPSGAIWDVDYFIADSISTDPNPCMAIATSNDLQAMRSETFIITATVTISNTTINNRSFIAVILAADGWVLGRTSMLQTEDSVTVTVLAQLVVGQRIRVQTYLNTVASTVAYTCAVTAALVP